VYGWTYRAIAVEEAGSKRTIEAEMPAASETGTLAPKESLNRSLSAFSEVIPISIVISAFRKPGGRERNFLVTLSVELAFPHRNVGTR